MATTTATATSIAAATIVTTNLNQGPILAARSDMYMCSRQWGSQLVTYAARGALGLEPTDVGTTAWSQAYVLTVTQCTASAHAHVHS